MVGRNVFRFGLVVLALFGARSAVADAINFTGNVATDFSISTPGTSTNPNVSVLSSTSTLNPSSETGAGGAQLLNFVSPGDTLKQIALDYNSTTDTMYVGIQTWGVAGSVPGSTIATGNGMVLGFTPLTGTYNPDNVYVPTFVAGTPNVSNGESSSATGRGTGLDGFNVAKYDGGTQLGTLSLLTGFGTTLPSGMGNLAFSPSSTTPGFEFTITNFSKLLGANPTNGVVVSFVDGEVNVDTSKDAFGGAFTVSEPQVIPEPATVLVWAGLAGGMAWGYRRRLRRLPS
jgi:hypothetical protein